MGQQPSNNNSVLDPPAKVHIAACEELRRLFPLDLARIVESYAIVTRREVLTSAIRWVECIELIPRCVNPYLCTCHHDYGDPARSFIRLQLDYMIKYTQLELEDFLGAVGVSKWWYYAWRYDTVAYQYKNLRIGYVLRAHDSRATVADACECYNEYFGGLCWFCEYSRRQKTSRGGVQIT